MSRAPTSNCDASSCISPACADSSAAALADSSALAAVRCVRPAIWPIDDVTSANSFSCSAAPSAMLFMIAAARCTPLRISCRRRVTLSFSLTPVSAFCTDSSISVAVLRDASEARMARLRTSSATTAKPLPASPARAASTAAFSASRFVWNAISSIVFTIFAVESAERLISATASASAVMRSTPCSVSTFARSIAARASLASATFAFVRSSTTLMRCET